MEKSPLRLSSFEAEKSEAATRSPYVLRPASSHRSRLSTASSPLSSPQQPFIPETLYESGHPPVASPPPRSRYKSSSPVSYSNFIVSGYLSVSHMLGFREKYSLLWAFIFGGALFGYCLARSLLMDPVRMRQLTVPGEFFWFEMPLYKFNYIIHIYLSIIGGIFSGAQFVPAIRRNYVLLHRLNGYLVLVAVFVSNVTGAIVARRSFGGELNSQAVYYATAIMSNLSLAWAFVNVKRNTRIHRRWMMRGVVYFSVVISARIIGLAAQAILTDIGSYYSLWRCDEILFVLKDIPTLLTSYPQCSSSTSTLTSPTLYVAVHASDNEGELGHASAVRCTQGMVLWIATLIHVVGCELYLRSTEEANFQRYGFILDHKDLDPESDTIISSTY